VEYINFPPTGTFAYELFNVTVCYLQPHGIQRIENKVKIEDPERLCKALMKLSKELGNKRPYNLTINDITHIIKNIMSWLKVTNTEDRRIGPLINGYVTLIRNLKEFPDAPLSTPPSLLKINFYEFERGMSSMGGKSGRKPEFKLDYNQIILSLIGATLSRVYMGKKDPSIYLTIPPTITTIDSNMHKKLFYIISRIGKAPSSTLIVIMTIKLIDKLDRDSEIATISYVQEGMRITLLSRHSIHTHGLISLFNCIDNFKKLINSLNTILDKYVEVFPVIQQKRNIPKETMKSYQAIINTIDSFSENLLIFTNTLSPERLYTCCTLLERLSIMELSGVTQEEIFKDNLIDVVDCLSTVDIKKLYKYIILL